MVNVIPRAKKRQPQLQKEKAYIDISKWWPVDEDGMPATVNSVAKQIEGTKLELNRHTLTRAKEGGLATVDVINLMRLTQLCTYWAGKTVKAEDIVKLSTKRNVRR